MNNRIFNIYELIYAIDNKHVNISMTNQLNGKFNHFMITIDYLGDNYGYTFDINSPGFDAQYELVKKELEEVFQFSINQEITVAGIYQIVSNYFNIPMEKLNSKTRKREIVQARQIAMYFAKETTKSSLTTIGSEIGGKDHATVLHACKTVNNLIDTDKRFRNYVSDIYNKIHPLEQ